MLRAEAERKTSAMLHFFIILGALVAAAFAVLALFNLTAARRTRRANPPLGKFIDVKGCRLHYVERGAGEVLVLLHGSGSMLQDFTASGLLDRAAQNFRVIAFDRPGYGYSTLPRGTVWTADAQAELIHDALAALNVPRAIVFGHSWAPLIAIALALKQPDMVRALVLASGFYYPKPDVQIALLSPVATPLAGSVLQWTVAPLLGRLAWNESVARNFDPRPVPESFTAFPKEMALRPEQIRTAAVETALLLPAAYAHRDDYGKLRMPVTIITGDSDRLIDVAEHSLRLHNQMPHSRLISLPGEGHMIHYTATEAVMEAIELTARESRGQ
jgi:pimeloyl-ACP methyl ester carboxylesterase